MKWWQKEGNRINNALVSSRKRPSDTFCRSLLAQEAETDGYARLVRLLGPGAGGRKGQGGRGGGDLT